MPKKSVKSDGDIGDLFDFRGQTAVLPQVKMCSPKKATPAECRSKPHMSSRYFSVSEVAQRYGVSDASIWRWVKNNDCFPPPIKLSSGTSRWSEEQLAEFEYRANLNQKNLKTSQTQKAQKNPTKGRTS